MKRLLLLVCFSFLFTGSALAAKVYNVSGPGGFGGKLDPLSCAGVEDVFKASGMANNLPLQGCQESWVDSAVKNRNGNAVLTDKFGNGYYTSISYVSGDCQRGRVSGTIEVPVAYVDKDNIDKVLQVIRDPMALVGSQGGCEMAAAEVGGCMFFTANQPALQTCPVTFKETGADAGGDASPDTSTPAYTGGIGGGGGGGTTPGDGGGTNPGGGGTNPGGGGTTPGGGGTTPGGGGTTPGDGGGGTTPGGGGTNPGGGGTGDTQAHCGAPGQPACSINEGNTPTGIGGLMDGLMKLVDGIGEGRQTGLDDAKSDSGKNTSLSIVSVNVPTGVCVNPTVSLPNMSGSWTVDVCRYVDMLSVAFDALWAFAFVVGVISLVGRATAKPVA